MAPKWEGKSLVGGRLGQFEVKDEIARGGMGVVYKGYQPSLDRWVAIKTLPMDLAGDRDLVARFQREAEAMVRLNHANIVQIIDRGEDTGQYYFAMEFVEGPSVKDLLKNETIDTDKLFDILCQTCDGLDYAHKKGLVHRDIKPANLLFEEKTGTVKIADFGIAHFSKKDEDMLTLTAENVGMGTMNYMSPEQKVNAKNVDHRADIYALGVIVYEAFTGKLPLGKFKLPSEVNPKLPRQLDAIVQKCMEAEPADRFESCADLKAALVDARASTHDKTLKRSMRDAFDRTLTAFGPNKSVGCSVLALIALVVVGGLATGAFFLWKSHATGGRLERAKAAVAAARVRAEKLGADRGAGKSSFEEGAAGVGAAEPLSGEAKAQALESAAAKFQSAASSAIDARKSEVAALLDRVDKVRARANQAGDGIAKAALAKLSEAERQAKAARDALAKVDQGGALEGLDASSAVALAADAETLVGKSEKLASTEKALLQKLADAKPDDPDRKTAEEKLAAMRKARDAGDPEAAFVALNDAATAASAATKTTRVDTSVPTPVASPSPAPTSDADPMALARQANADHEASSARRDAERVLEAAKKIDLSDGSSDLEAGLAAQKEAATLKPRAAADKLDAATTAFKKATDAALAALEARRKQARGDAANAKDQPEYSEADALDGDLQTETDPAARARLMVRQIGKFKEAAQKALDAGRATAQGLQQKAEQGRESALARLGAGGDARLGSGDAALARGKKALADNQVATARTELETAAAEYAKASWPTPTSVTFPKDLTHGLVLAKNLKGLDDDDGGVESIAGCPKGFVLAFKKKLYCYDLGFKEATQSATAPGPISAICAGDGDELFVATLSPGTIYRYSTAKASIKQLAPLPGDLGQPHDDPALALAYDPRTKLLYTASKNAVVYVYSTTTGDVQGSPIDLKDSQIALPFSIAVLSDGTFVVAGDADHDRPAAESAFRCVAARYKTSGELAEVYNRSPGPSAVAAVGDGLLVLDHAEEGHLWICSKPTGLGQAPDPGIMLHDERPIARPKWATKLAVFGRTAFVLDQPFDDPATTYRPWRKRIRVYEVK